MTILPIQRLTMRTVAVLSATAMVALLTGVASSASAKDDKATTTSTTVRRTVLQFPIDVDPSVTTIPNQGEVEDMVSDVVLSRLSSSGVYTVSLFSKTLPAIARLRTENQLTDGDISAPFNNSKAAKVTKGAEYEVAFVGSIDDYKFDSDNKQAEIALTGSLIDVTTGKVIKLVALSAQSDKGGKATEDERALAAARNAGEKLMSQLVKQAPVVTKVDTKTVPDKAVKPHKKKPNLNWLWGALLAVGVGIAISSGGSGGGGGIDVPPSPPH